MIKLAKGELEWNLEDVDTHISNIMGAEYPLEFTEGLDEANETFKLGNYEYPPSKILASTDPVVFKQIYLQWEDEKIQELAEQS